jgi:hypothetical protein
MYYTYVCIIQIQQIYAEKIITTMVFKKIAPGFAETLSKSQNIEPCLNINQIPLCNFTAVLFAQTSLRLLCQGQLFYVDLTAKTFFLLMHDRLMNLLLPFEPLLFSASCTKGEFFVYTII